METLRHGIIANLLFLFLVFPLWWCVCGGREGWWGGERLGGEARIISTCLIFTVESFFFFFLIKNHILVGVFGMYLSLVKKQEARLWGGDVLWIGCLWISVFFLENSTLKISAGE